MQKNVMHSHVVLLYIFYYSRVSDSAKNLIKKMLTKDVNKRISADEAL